MRKDIEIHINTGDITLVSRRQFAIQAFNWVDNPGGLSDSIYGEIEVPYSFSEESIFSNGLYVKIPYKPDYRRLKLCIKKSNDGSYVRNKENNDIWFSVQSGLYGGEVDDIYACQLQLIHPESYYIKFSKTFATAMIYSSCESDMNIVEVNRQNANLLLKCAPSNCYRYPLSGVGLIKFVNSNMNHAQLAEAIQTEFIEDGILVSNASFDFETKDLFLDLNALSAKN